MVGNPLQMNDVINYVTGK